MKTRAALLIAMFVILLVVLVFTVRNLINFGNISSYIEQEKLVGMVYDLIYFSSCIQIIFLGMVITLSLYVIKIVESVENIVVPKPKKTKKPKSKKPKKAKPKKEKKKGESNFLRQWRHLEKEAEQ